MSTARPRVVLRRAREQRLEIVTLASSCVEARERVDDPGLLAELGRGRAVGGDGLVAITDLLLEHLCDVEEQATADRRARRAREARLERIDELVPALRLAEDRDARVERVHVGRVRGQALGPRAEGTIVDGELGRELRHEPEDATPLARIALDRGLRLEGSEPISSALGPIEEGAQLARDLEPDGLTGLAHGEHASIRSLAARRVARARAHVRRVEEERHATRSRRPLGCRFERLRVCSVIARALGQLTEPVGGDAVARIEQEQARDVGERARRIATRRHALCELAVEIDRAFARLAIEREGEDPLDVRAAPRSLVRFLEGREGLAPHLERGARVDQHLLRDRRRTRIARLGEDLRFGQRGRRIRELVEVGVGDPRTNVGGAGLVLELASPERDQLGVLVLALEQALERGEELRVVRAQIEELREVADGTSRLPGEVLRELRRLFEEARAPEGVVARSLDGPIEVREQIGPALLDRQHDRDALQGPREPGVELEDALEHVDEVRRGLAEPLLVEAERALSDALDELGREARREHLAVRRTDLVGALELGREVFELVPALLVGRRRFDGSDQLGDTRIQLAHRGPFRRGALHQGDSGRRTHAGRAGSETITGCSFRSPRCFRPPRADHRHTENPAGSPVRRG